MERRCLGLDVHREFAQVAIWEDGLVRHAGQIALCDEKLRIFADSLGPEDEVSVEATCNTHAIVRLIGPRVARVVVSDPQKTRAIAEAKVKTDKVDTEVLAQLLAADYLPSVWVADPDIQALRPHVVGAIQLALVAARGKGSDGGHAASPWSRAARCGPGPPPPHPPGCASGGRPAREARVAAGLNT